MPRKYLKEEDVRVHGTKFHPQYAYIPLVETENATCKLIYTGLTALTEAYMMFYSLFKINLVLG